MAVRFPELKTVIRSVNGELGKGLVQIGTLGMNRSRSPATWLYPLTGGFIG